jgi:O-antigen/teichoic acid export membrane protein
VRRDNVTCAKARTFGYRRRSGSNPAAGPSDRPGTRTCERAGALRGGCVSSSDETFERLEDEAIENDRPRVDPARSGTADDGRAANIKQIRGSSLLLVGRMLGLALDFVSQVLIVRHLSKGEYGAFALALSIVAIGTTVSLLGMERTVGRFAPIYQERRDFGRMWGSIAVVVLTVVSIGFALIIGTFAFQGVIGGVIDSQAALSVLLIMIALSPLQALDALLVALFATFGSARSIFFRRYVFAPVLQLSIVVGVILTSRGVNELAAGYVLAAAIGTAIYVVVLYRLLARQGVLATFDRRMLKLPFREIFTFSIPLLASDLVFTLRGSLTVVLIQLLRTTEEVAEFRAVLPLAIQNLFVATSFRFIFTPGASRLFARDDRQALDDLYWQTAVWIAILTFPLFALCVAFGEPLSAFLFGERYRSAGVVLSIMAIGYYFNGSIGFNSLLLRVFGKVRYMVVTDMSTAVLGVVVSILLIRQFGAVGAAIGTTSILVLQNLLYQWGLRSRTTVHAFDRRYTRAYASIVIGVIALLIVNLLFRPSFPVAFLLTALVSLAVLGLNRHDLRILETYPELGRYGIVRRIFGGTVAP